MCILIILHTQQYRPCTFGLSNTTTYSGCPDQPSSVRLWVHNRVNGRGVPSQTFCNVYQCLQSHKTPYLVKVYHLASRFVIKCMSSSDNWTRHQTTEQKHKFLQKLYAMRQDMSPFVVKRIKIYVQSIRYKTYLPYTFTFF